jgi:predicted DNA-binding transcriptional regulator AlpA
MTSDEKFKTLPDCACITTKEFAALTGLSLRTVTQLEAEGEAPPRVRLSKRRYGYTVASVRQWLKARTITSGDAA